MNMRIATLVAVATAAAFPLLASGSPTRQAAGAPGTTIKLVERGGGVRFVDSAPPHARRPYDFSPGDFAIVTRKLYDASGSRTGSLEIACVSMTATHQQCTGTVTLAGGTLEVAGVSAPRPTTLVAITGGTGAYAGESGTALAKDRPGNGDVADLTLVLEH